MTKKFWWGVLVGVLLGTVVMTDQSEFGSGAASFSRKQETPSALSSPLPAWVPGILARGLRSNIARRRAVVVHEYAEVTSRVGHELELAGWTEWRYAGEGEEGVASENGTAVAPWARQGLAGRGWWQVGDTARISSCFLRA